MNDVLGGEKKKRKPNRLLQKQPNLKKTTVRIKPECNAAPVYESSKLAKYKKTGGKEQKGMQSADM